MTINLVMNVALMNPSACLGALQGGTFASSAEFTSRLGQDLRLLEMHPAVAPHVWHIRAEGSEAEKMRHVAAIQRKAGRLTGDFASVYGNKPITPVEFIQKHWIRFGHRTGLANVLAASDAQFGLSEYAAPLGGCFTFSGKKAAVVDMRWEPRLRNLDTQDVLPAKIDVLKHDGKSFAYLSLPATPQDILANIDALHRAGIRPAENTEPDKKSAAYETEKGGSCLLFYDPERQVYFYAYEAKDLLHPGEDYFGMFVGNFKSTSGFSGIRLPQNTGSTSAEIFVSPNALISWARGSVWFHDATVQEIQPDTPLLNDRTQYIYYPGHVIEINNCGTSLEQTLKLADEIIKTIIPNGMSALRGAAIQTDQPLKVVPDNTNTAVTLISAQPGLPIISFKISFTRKSDSFAPTPLWEVEIDTEILSGEPVKIRAFELKNKTQGETYSEFLHDSAMEELAFLMPNRSE